MRRKSKPAYHHGDLERALVQTAIRLIDKSRGTGELTLREVARHAGVSHTAPYRHYADKRALLAAVAEDGFRKLRDQLRNARRDAGEDARARFIATGQAYMRFALEHASHFQVMYGPDVAKSDSPPLQREANETFQLVKELAFDARGSDCPVDEARHLGVIVWSTVHGLALLVMNRQIPASVGAAPDALVTLALSSLFDSWSVQAPLRNYGSVTPPIG